MMTVKSLHVLIALFILMSCGRGLKKSYPTEENFKFIEQNIDKMADNMSFVYRRIYFGDREIMFTRYGEEGRYLPMYSIYSNGDCYRLTIRDDNFPDSLMPNSTLYESMSEVMCTLALRRLESDNFLNIYVSFSDTEKPEYVYSKNEETLDTNYVYSKYKNFWYMVN